MIQDPSKGKNNIPGSDYIGQHASQSVPFKTSFNIQSEKKFVGFLIICKVCKFLLSYCVTDNLSNETLDSKHDQTSLYFALNEYVISNNSIRFVFRVQVGKPN